ncbi:MAG: 2,3-bisphosphoglycerate-independent phosphoglycerate mutase [Phycisphaerae bacterium]|nr:2,3-bisphosphoglycerate-independent phosphoglycerate mutase [Phycisphaerae bacterium]
MPANVPAVRNTPCILIIRDGWGRNPHPEHHAFNATELARTPVAEALEREWPHTLIRTSGEDVGLPVEHGEPVMGNSEVGHQNIGAGRIVDQELMRITRAIRNGEFARNPVLLAACARAKEMAPGEESAATSGAAPAATSGVTPAAGPFPRALHIMGLVGDGKVHSDFAHLCAILHVAREQGVPSDRIFVHAFTDGRDTPPTSGLACIERLEGVLRETGGRIATISGRYWAMDRDHRWDRVQRAYDAIMARPHETAAEAQTPERSGAAAHASATRTGRFASTAASTRTAASVLRDYYAHPTAPNLAGDEFLPPTRLLPNEGVVNDGDAVVFFNFRGDRPRELVGAFVLSDQAWAKVKNGGFARDPRPRDLLFATMSGYQEGLPVEVIFDRPARMPNILGEYISALGLTQFRCAETEKFPHVTFFFNDYREQPFPGERRALVPSPTDVRTYDEKPEMSARGVCDAVLARIAAPNCEPLIVVNFANPDMVGHTGNLAAVVKACEVVDACVGEIVRAAIARGGSAIVTADHGNAEQMKIPPELTPHTAHTNYAVPLFVAGNSFKGASLRSDGRLADIAPTLLAMMGLPKPPEMLGTSLIQ